MIAAQKPNYPVVALVGRPNVGKSTLFNALTGTRRALVADVEGVTRDRRMGVVTVPELNNKPLGVMDTGGWMPERYRKGTKNPEMLAAIESQIEFGLSETSLVLLIVDIRAGITDLDKEIARNLQRLGHEIIVVCNKWDSDKQSGLEMDFFALGAKCFIRVSAEHKRGFFELWDAIAEHLPTTEESIPVEILKVESGEISIGIVGRPNVGKSSLLNTLFGAEHAVASPIPGTTTDPVDRVLIRGSHQFRIIDTAGIRRHARRADDVEQLSVMYAKRNLSRVDLAFLVVDAEDGVTAQDARIAKLVQDAGCGAVVIANKWDLAPEHLKRESKDALDLFIKHLRMEMPFLDYAPVVAFSALRGKLYAAKAGVDADKADPMRIDFSIDGLWTLVRELVEARNRKLTTSELNRLVQHAREKGPNLANNVGKVYFAHRLTGRSPVFCAYVKKAKEVPNAYRRYLVHCTRSAYGFRGNPIRWLFRDKALMAKAKR